jgi:hypothetical protein
VKAETHNHPSAIEPFGGANTGVGGVIRDVMGAGHRRRARPTCSASARPRRPGASRGRAPPALVAAGVVAGWRTTATRSGCRPSRAPSSTTRAHREPARVLRVHRRRAGAARCG